MNVEPRAITYSLTERENRKMRLAAYWVWLELRCVSVFLPVGLILNMPVFLQRGHHDESTMQLDLLYLCFVLAWCGFKAWRCLRANNLYRTAPELWKNISWEIDSSGLIFRREDDRTTFPWKTIKKVLRKHELLIICLVDRREIHIPCWHFNDGGRAWRDAIAIAIQRDKGSPIPKKD